MTIAERIPGGAPPGIHDPALFVDRDRLVAEAARHGVRLTLTGMRPPLVGMVRWLARRDPDPRMRADPADRPCSSRDMGSRRARDRLRRRPRWPTPPPRWPPPARSSRALAARAADHDAAGAFPAADFADLRPPACSG